jgi:RimJ/RimL family protein N-acetyltransferase
MRWNDDLVPYKIATDRLVLKCWEPRYAAALLDQIQRSSDALLPWMPFAKPPFPTVTEEINLVRTFRANYDLGKDYMLAILDSTETMVIGSTGLHPRLGPGTVEIGYWIGREHQRQGYATEAAQALIHTAFSLTDVHRVEINCAAENHASRHVIEKLGLTFEGTLRNQTQDAFGHVHDLLKWSFTPEEFRSSDHRALRLRFWDSTGAELSLP